MHKFNTIKQIHLEISNNCQASCPMCNRNIHGGLDNPLIKVNNWSLEQFKTIMNHEVLDQVRNFYFCGNFGDPILNTNLIEMCRYAADYNPNLDIRIHTNGSAHTKEWWAKLAAVLPKQHSVIFALDGLADTHSIYRIGTSFDKIINNAKSFISAGGHAEWVYIKFKHNEHQVAQAEQLANELGFAKFTVKNSSRFVGTTKFNVVDRQGQTIYNLEPAANTPIKFIDKNVIANYKKIVADSTINCAVKQTNELYIDADMNVFPCCYLGSIPYTFIEDDDTVPIRKEIQRQFKQFLAEHGGLENLNALTYGIKEIVNRPIWDTIWDTYWHSEKLITCARTCGVNALSKPMDQFINE